MPRKFQPLVPNTPYFISSRCINREWFRIPLPEVWTLASDYLHFIHHAYEVKIFAFVLMSNHYHMIAQAPELGGAMNYFNRETSRIISKRSGRINQVYGGPYHKSLLTTEDAFRRAYKYLYRNPVDAGLAKSVESYNYSTLPTLLGQQHGSIPLAEDTLLFPSTSLCLEWLNTPYPLKERTSVKYGLRRAVFQLSQKSQPRRLRS